MGSRLALLPGILGISLVLEAGVPSAPPAGGPGNEKGGPAPIHTNAAELERALLDATAAFLREDDAAARAAYDRAESSCRRLGRADSPAYSADVVVMDEALHKTFDVVREFTARGKSDAALDQLLWTVKLCRRCHDLVRKEARTARPAPPTAPPAQPREAN